MSFQKIASNVISNKKV